jgi:hypothetical protein
MSLRQSLEAEHAASRKGPLCGMAVVYSKLDDDDRAALDSYLADREGVTTAAISRALTSEGHRVGKNTVERHRRGECSCGKGA